MASSPKTHPIPAEPLQPTTSLTAESDADPAGAPVVPANASWWHRIGGGSLSISVIFHAIVILLAVLIYFEYTKPGAEVIDYLPGGGGGGKGSEAKIAEKRRAATASAPKTRIVSIATDASVSLPDISTSMSDFSSLTKAAPMGGGMGGGSGGLRGKGSGGLMGDGQGTGMGPGMGRGFIAMFGAKLDARRMAVVLDVSASMYNFLPTVIKEVDKVAPGSVVILHFGCGLSNAEVAEPGVQPTTDKSFDSDRIATSLLSSQTKSMNQQEREALLEMVKKRPKTYFVPSSGVGSTWIALTDTKLKDSDAIYWFADFADAQNEQRIEEVSRKLKTRRQKLYIHPSNPKWLNPGDPLAANVAKTERELVSPSGGKVINSDVKKDGEVNDKNAKKKPGA